MKESIQAYDAAIIGGGLTGLTAAVYLARAGRSVILLEKERRLGGMAETTRINGALFNLGPHAMYEGGAALRILRELDCEPPGGYAAKSGMLGILQGRIVDVSRDLSAEESGEWSGLMGGLSGIDTDAVGSLSLRDWSQKKIRHERVRLLFEGMCRQWTYSGDMSALSAGFAIRQGQLAALGVRYVDRGWQAAVERLRGAAVQAGAVLAAGRAAERVLLRDGRVRGVSLADGSALEAAAVLMAAGPEEACRLVPGSARMSLGKWRGEARPLYAACLDIALKRPPCPERVFALGLDEPLYFSKHSGPVSLSDDGSAVFHAMKYNGTDGGSDAKADESRLTELLDLLEPGWDKEIAAMRFTPGVLVAHDSRPACRHGAGPAPGPSVPEASGLFVAGDWVGADGRLADAAMASAKAAAEAILRRR